MSMPAASGPADWITLWGCAGQLAAARDTAPETVFLPIGLCLEDPATAARWEYTTTPADGLTFASTGRNGVHFSFVGDSAGPVVMTVPAAFDSPNRVVGGDLREFLALGCRTGYRRLEALAHGFARRDAIRRLGADAEVDTSEAEAELLGRLRAALDLRPWPDVGGRLAELAAAG
ncbi:hypothetical protein [Pseudonocardia lacus]|uniref:hypothetical protein n=1 Tax=Pseudonocardia lacus TaxID=2835865 RepID=UPI001BDBFF1E|nr:hypothetical protein [Pseudonocardia lacus]